MLNDKITYQHNLVIHIYEKYMLIIQVNGEAIILKRQNKILKL